MDQNLKELVNRGVVDLAEAKKKASNPDTL